MNENIQQATMWTTGYLPNGCKVSFTVPVAMLDAYETAVAFTDALLKKGFRQTEDGVEPGEEKEMVGYICRRVKMNDDDSETPIVDLYSVNDQLTFKMLTVYLNTADDVKAFEAASGMRLDSMQVYASKAAPERGDKLTDKYIYRAPKPFVVIRKLNPAHAADNMKPKYKFVRWDGVVTQPQAPTASEPKAEPDLKSVVKTFTVFAVQTREKVDEKGNRTIFYQMPTGSEYVYAYNRDVFRAAGLVVTDNWKKPGFGLKFDKPIEVKAEQKPGKDGKGYWQAIPPELPKDLQPTGTDGKPADDIPF